jgi:hypothetical protein
MRTIKAISTKTINAPVKFMSDATTFGELVTELVANGVDLTNCEVVDSKTKVTYKDASAVLPMQDLSLMILPVNIKLGHDQFSGMTASELKECYEQMVGRTTKVVSPYTLRSMCRTAHANGLTVKTGSDEPVEEVPVKTETMQGEPLPVPVKEDETKALVVAVMSEMSNIVAQMSAVLERTLELSEKLAHTVAAQYELTDALVGLIPVQEKGCATTCDVDPACALCDEADDELRKDFGEALSNYAKPVPASYAPHSNDCDCICDDDDEDHFHSDEDDYNY